MFCLGFKRKFHRSSERWNFRNEKRRIKQDETRLQALCISKIPSFYERWNFTNAQEVGRTYLMQILVGLLFLAAIIYIILRQSGIQLDAYLSKLLKFFGK